MSALKHEELSQEENELLKKFFKTPPLDDYIRYPHGPVIMPRSYLDIEERIRNFDVKLMICFLNLPMPKRKMMRKHQKWFSIRTQMMKVKRTMQMLMTLWVEAMTKRQRMRILVGTWKMSK